MEPVIMGESEAAESSRAADLSKTKASSSRNRAEVRWMPVNQAKRERISYTLDENPPGTGGASRA